MDWYQTFRSRLRRYLGISKWMAMDALWRYRRAVLGILTASSLGVVSQAAALAMIISYAQALQDGKTFELIGTLFDIRASYTVLAVTALGATVLLGFSALCIYWAATRSLTMGREYEVFCNKRAISLATHVVHATQPGAGFPVADDRVMSMIAGDGRLCARGFRNLVNAIPAAMAFIVFSAAMVYLDPLLTLIVVAILASAGLLLYRVGLAAAGGTMQMESSQYYAGPEKRAIRDTLSWGAAPWAVDHPILKSIFETGHLRKVIDARLGADASQESGTAISAILGAVVLAVIILVKGAEIMMSGEGWGDLFVFLLVGRFALSYFLNLSQNLTGLNRLYPRIARYFLFVDSAEGTAATDPGAEKAARERPLKIVFTQADGGSGEMVLALGSRTAFIHPGPVSRFTMLACEGAFESDSGPPVVLPLTAGMTWLTPPRPPAFTVSPRAFFGLPEDLAPQDLARELGGLGIPVDGSKILAKTLDQDLGPQRWRKIPVSVIAATAWVAAAHSTRPLVVGDGRFLAKVGNDMVRKFLDSRFANRIVIFSYQPRDIGAIGKLGEKTVLISDGEAIVDAVPVTEIDGSPAIQRLLAEHAPSTAPSSGDPAEEEDEEI